MNYFIIGGIGFIGIYFVSFLYEVYFEIRIYNLDIVELGILLLIVKNYKLVLGNGEEYVVIFIYCDVCQLIELEKVNIIFDDVIFNFVVVYCIFGYFDFVYFEINICGVENVCVFVEWYGIWKIVFISFIVFYGVVEELKEEIMLFMFNILYGIFKLVVEKIYQIWQVGGEGCQFIIVCFGVVFGWGENGNFMCLYWGIWGYKFMYLGCKDIIKVCIYVKELVWFMFYRLEYYDSGVELYNCCYEFVYMIEYIVEFMKRVINMKVKVFFMLGWLIMIVVGIVGVLGFLMGICLVWVRKLQIFMNICGKKLFVLGYCFCYIFEEVLVDWYKDNGNLYL